MGTPDIDDLVRDSAKVTYLLNTSTLGRMWSFMHRLNLSTGLWTTTIKADSLRYLMSLQYIQTDSYELLLKINWDSLGPTR